MRKEERAAKIQYKQELTLTDRINKAIQAPGAKSKKKKKKKKEKEEEEESKLWQELK